MGRVLVDIFETIKKEGGLSAQMRLAMLVGISSKRAVSIDDTPELVQKFASAYKEVLGCECPASILKGLNHDYKGFDFKTCF
ncbi:MAG: hypothetical protein LBH03_04325 [Holophagales bacterium]|nr:hypothetical protein [Holophagales bacterium]